MKEAEAGPAPEVTVAVINHHLRGYPVDCLESLGAGDGPPGAEFLLVQGSGAGDSDDVARRFPNVRILSLELGDRATAKNLAVSEARGRLLLLATADTVVTPGTVRRLRQFIDSHPRPAAASPQLLNENGTRRRTAYRFPSLRREINLLGWLTRLRHRVWRKGTPAAGGPPVRAAALHATVLMAPTDLFRQVGPFAEDYRFGYEDVEWCWRAARLGVERYIVREARAYKLAPQLYGELPPEVRLGMEQSARRFVEATRGAAYARCFRGIRRAKALVAWLLAGSVNWIRPGHSLILASEAGGGRAVWRMTAGRDRGVGLPPDVESDVRWEHTA